MLHTKVVCFNSFELTAVCSEMSMRDMHMLHNFALEQTSHLGGIHVMPKNGPWMGSFLRFGTIHI